MVGGCGTEDHLFSYCASDTNGQAAVEQALVNSDFRDRVEHLLQAQYQQVRTQIAQNHETVTAIAEALLLCHTLTESDISEIVAWVAGRRLATEAVEQGAN
jgi:ATP-dependent Zn protease